MGNLSSCFGLIATISHAGDAPSPANGVSSSTHQKTCLTSSSSAQRKFALWGRNQVGLRSVSERDTVLEANQDDRHRNRISCPAKSTISTDTRRQHLHHRTFGVKQETWLDIEVVGMSDEMFSLSRAKIFAKLEAKLPRYYEAVQQFAYVRMLQDPIRWRREGMHGEVFSRNRAKLFAKMEHMLPRYRAAVLQFGYVNMLSDRVAVKGSAVQERVQEFEKRSRRQVRGRIRPEEELGEKPQHEVASFGSSLTSSGPSRISPRHISDVKL